MKSAAAIATEIMILLNIDSRITQFRPHVEEGVQRDPGFVLTIMSTRCFSSLFATGLWSIAKPFEVAIDMLVVIMESSENDKE